MNYALNIVVLGFALHTSLHGIIPYIDMSKFIRGNADERKAVACVFGEALQTVGFVALTNIGISEEAVMHAYHAAQQFFELPIATRMQLRMHNGIHGYVPFRTEHAKYTSVSDLKEFYHLTGHSQPAELWPQELPEFKNSILDLYMQLEQATKYCLQAIAIYLGYEDAQENILADMFALNTGVMRVLHYPPLDFASVEPNALRSAPHEDLGMMTIIPYATSPGLQVKLRSGEWVDAIPSETDLLSTGNSLQQVAIVNAGDTLSRITNYMIPSTTHRVVNPSPENNVSRFSIPLFGSLPLNTMLRVLDKCKGATPTDQLPAEITYGEFLFERMKKIGIY